jgi:hypothetical protein
MDQHRTKLILFAVAMTIAILIASVATLERVDTHRVSNDGPPGTTGLARPHQQLDRAPGEPLPQGR